MPLQPQRDAGVVVPGRDVNALDVAAGLQRDEVIADFRSAALEILPDVESFALRVLDHAITQKLHVPLAGIEADTSCEHRRITARNTRRNVATVAAVASARVATATAG